MRLTRVTPINNQKGFTLVELMLVISLMGIVLAAAYQFFFFTHKSYAMADARSAAIQETDLFFLQLEKDIRSASEPNSITKAINITNTGKQIDIYCAKDVPSDDDPDITVSQYYLTSYRLNGTDIQRGFVSSADQSSDLNPQYGGIPDTGDGAWKTLVNNILPDDTAIFSDSRNDSISSRRLIDVDIYVKPPELNNSINVQTSLLSRNGKSTSSIVASTTGSAYKEVSYIKFYNNAGTEITSLSVAKGGADVYITAKAFAQDGTPATNKNILFKQNLGSISWADFPDYSLLYDDATGDLIEATDLNFDLYRDRLVVRSGQSVMVTVDAYDTIIPWYGSTRNCKLQAVSPDGATATLIISQNH